MIDLEKLREEVEYFVAAGMQTGVASEDVLELLDHIEQLKEDLQFVERWAVHHGSKPTCTAKEALSVIQHYPSIRAITDSYSDGKRPETSDPYARIAQLEKDAGLMKDCVGSLRFIRDTFQNDLKQGYITKDKQFCVDMAKPYLAAIDTAMEASNG